MARPIKQGLDYFPFDVDLIDDDKLQFVQARFGIKGVFISIKILAKIYKEGGYAIKWDDDVSLLFANRVGENTTHALVNDVVAELLKRGFLNQDIFKRFRILTSKGIQERYTKICKLSGRKDWEIDKKLDLLKLTNGETQLNTELIELTHKETIQSKVKESKVKESIYSGLAENSISWEQVELFLKFYEWAKKVAPRIYEMDKPLTALEYTRLLSDGIEKKMILEICTAMHNYKELTKRVSANLTIRDWAKRRIQDSQQPNHKTDAMPLLDGNEILRKIQERKQS